MKRFLQHVLKSQERTTNVFFTKHHTIYEIPLKETFQFPPTIQIENGNLIVTYLNQESPQLPPLELEHE